MLEEELGFAVELFVGGYSESGYSLVFLEFDSWNVKVLFQLLGDLFGGSEPDGFAWFVEEGFPVRFNFAQPFVFNESRIAGIHLGENFWIAFFVADHVCHCRQADRNGMRNVWNAFSEWNLFAEPHEIGCDSRTSYLLVESSVRHRSERADCPRKRLLAR